MFTGSYAIDVRDTVYFIGNTNVDYSTTCNSLESCTTTFTLFRADGVWDILSNEGGDGIGKDDFIDAISEPYAFNTSTFKYSYPNPHTSSRLRDNYRNRNNPRLNNNYTY